MTAKKVLFLDHTAQLGGGELSLLDLLEGLDRSNYSPSVVLASDGPLTQKIRDLGIDVRVVPLDPRVLHTRKDTLRASALLKIRSMNTTLLYAFRIAKLARQLKVELIHTNSLKSDIYGGLAGRIAFIPTVWHVRDRIDEHYLPKAAMNSFRLLCKMLPHAVIANSQSTLSCLAVRKKQRSAVVYGSVRPEAVVYDGLSAEHADSALIRSQEDSYSGQPMNNTAAEIVAVVGRIAEWKGQHIFIKAAADVLKQHPRTQFWIVGSPLFGESEYERSLHHQVDLLGLQDSIHFLGFRKDVSEILQKVTIVVHSSCLGEPFGRVVIEGMAAAKPVVATNGGALPEIITDGVNGKLVPMNDAGAMATAIAYLLSDPEKARTIGRNGRQKVLDCFTMTQTARGVERVYDLVLAAA